MVLLNLSLNTVNISGMKYYFPKWVPNIYIRETYKTIIKPLSRPLYSTMCSFTGFIGPSSDLLTLKCFVANV